ncbi:MAG: peptidase, partial [Marmoricola sp.]|nr:peptidase [Marmoricola sp.]
PAPAREGVWPLTPRPQVARGFSPPASAWGAGHRGVDLEGRPGQAVRASLAGTVVFAAVLAGRGVVVVQHGGLRTTYEPVDAVVGVGDVLARGAVLGRLRVAGSHCFPRACLHWGLRRGTAYLDPLVLVGLGPLRLLPAPSATGAVPGGSSWSGTASSGSVTDPSADASSPRSPARAGALGSPGSPAHTADRGPLAAAAWWWAGAGSGARVGLAVRRAQAL